MGPQGDARRIYNYARCVAGGVAFNEAKGDGAAMPRGMGGGPGGSGMGPGTGQGGGSGMGPGGGSNSGGQQGMQGGMQGGQGGPPGGPPQEAFDSCEGASQGDACSFEAPHGEISGTCAQPPGMEEMLCIPSGGRMGRQ